MNYEQLYNSPGSHKKADNSWERYMNPTDKEDHTRERYEYSISYLYGDVLDVGAGDGFGAYLMQQNKEITSITCVEVHDEAIKKMRYNIDGVEIVKAAAEDMYLGLFDSIHCGHTLEHVEDLEKALENIKREAKDRVVISVPINGGISHIHLREFKSVEEVENILSGYFDIEEQKVFTKNSSVSSAVFVMNV